jgi:hypothetical protein
MGVGLHVLPKLVILMAISLWFVHKLMKQNICLQLMEVFISKKFFLLCNNELHFVHSVFELSIHWFSPVYQFFANSENMMTH